MSSIRTYSIVFVLLMIFSTTQAALEFVGVLESAYWLAFAAILVLSFTKAGLVAGWFQHLRSEPRSVTYLIATGLVVVLALTTAAAYSIS